jgi:Holliday junction resolvase RusA-like endonuclease
MNYTFLIPGEPVAKGRPRFARVGKFVRTFTPQKSARFEDRVRLCAINAGVKPIAGPVRLEVFCYWPTKGAPRKRDPWPVTYKITRPDADNVLKAICDGLSGTGFLDDAQVAEARITKMHAAQGSPPCVRVEIGGMDA